MRDALRVIAFLIISFLFCAAGVAADTQPLFKTVQPKTAVKPGVVNVIDLGVAGLKIDSLKLKESADSCQWQYEVTVRNAGLKSVTGTIGLGVYLHQGPNKITGGTNTLHITNLAPGKTYTEIKPIIETANSKYNKLSLNLTSGSKVVDTKIIDLTIHYTAQIPSAKVESGMVNVSVKNTSNVAANMFFNVFKPDAAAQGGWKSIGGRGMCAGAGQTIVENVAAPQGWPSSPNTLKVVLKSGTDVLAEKIINAQ